MGRGRVKATALCCAALALAAAGCGAEEHESEPRSQPPTRVSVAVSDQGITVSPSRIAIGPEPTQQIPQNSHASQPPLRSKAPLNVVLVAANLTNTDSKLLLRGPRSVESQNLVANGNESLLAKLPTGVYTVAAAGLPQATPAKLTVGPYRTSSDNDVLLP